MSEELFGQISLQDVEVEESRLNDTKSNNFLDQFIPMPTVQPGQEKKISVRILPPARGSDNKLYQYNRIHSINGRKYACLRPLKGTKWDYTVYCPICAYYSALWKKIEKLEQEDRKSEAEELKQEARDLKPIERYYYNAIARKIITEEGTKENFGPAILSIGKTLHKKIVDRIVGDEYTVGANVSDVKNGYDFIISRAVTPGENNYPKYDQSMFASSPSPAGTPEELAEWAENLHDLSKFRKTKDPEFLEHQLKIHRGLVKDDSTNSFDIDEFDKKHAEDQGTVKNETVSQEIPESFKNKNETVSQEIPESVKTEESSDIEVDDIVFDNDGDDLLEELKALGNDM